MSPVRELPMPNVERAELWILLLGIILASAACATSTHSRVESYFRTISARQDLDRQLNQLANNYHIDLETAPDNEKAVITAEHYENSLPIMRELSGFIATVPPPPEVEKAHNGFLAALTQAEESISDVIPELRAAHSWAEARQALLDKVLPAFLYWNQACQALQDVAASNHIGAPFACLGSLAAPV